MPWFEPIRSALLPILQIGYHFLIVATVLCVTALIVAVNSKRFAKLSDAFFKLTHFQRVVAIMCIVIATVYAQKDDGDDGAGAPRMMMAPMVTPMASDVEDLTSPTNSALAISGIEVGTNSVALGISWTDALSPTNNCLDLFASWDLLSGKWSHLAEIDLGTASSNIVAEIDFSLYPTNALERTAFFRIATQADSDMDGLSDMYEEWVLGTDPENPDTDGDGIFDGYEVADELNPLNEDTDGDGIPDGDEVENGTDPSDANDYDFEANDFEVESEVIELNFDEEQENTQTDDPVDYEMIGQYSVNVDFDVAAAIPNFYLLGVPTPGGVTTRSWPSNNIWYDDSSPYFSNVVTVVASGGYFKPHKTGRYFFQAEVDDTVTATIGTDDGQIDVTADFGGVNPGAVTNAIFIANRLYPVSFCAHSIGGPVALKFPIWGNFEPILKPKLVAGFDKYVVVFEDERLAGNGVMMPRRSSQVNLDIDVKGGGLGGVLNVETIGLEKLACVNGELARTRNIAPNEHYEQHSMFEGISSSDFENDVEVVVSFVENETLETIATTTTVTVVKAEVKALSQTPAQNKRHIFGPLEDVELSVSPQTMQSRWSIESSTSPTSITTNSANVIAMLRDKGKTVVRLELFGSTTRYKLYTIRPKDVGAITYSCTPTDDDPSRVEAWVWLRTYLVLLPTYVSFENLELTEGECDATNLSDNLVGFQLPRHDSDHGAYAIRRVGTNNDAGRDTALIYNWPTNIAPCHFQYDIPQYWRIAASNDNWKNIGNSPCIKTQYYELDAEGNFSVSKFGCTATRKVNVNNNSE